MTSHGTTASAAPAADSGPVIARVMQSPEVWVTVDELGAALARGPVTVRDAARAAELPPWRSREFLAARALLRTLLHRVAGAAWLAPIDADERGRPVLARWPRLGISISHDSGFVAACAGRGTAVGVDIQMPPDRLDEPVLRRCLGRHLGLLADRAQADRIRAFTWVWTAQEACVKARGDGLAGHPWTIDVRPGATCGHWQGYRWIALPELSEVPLSCAFAVPSGAS